MRRFSDLPPKRFNTLKRLEIATKANKFVEKVDFESYDLRRVLINGESYYPFIFSKTLQHDETGMVKSSDVDVLLNALKHGEPTEFDKITRAEDAKFKLVAPQMAHSASLIGCDLHQMHLDTSFAFDTDKGFSEMLEVYEMSLLRDVPFEDIQNNNGGIVDRVLKVLNRFPEFEGPKTAGAVLGSNLFRGTHVDELVGPYVSQLFYLPFNYGAKYVEQKYQRESDTEESIHMDYWLGMQNGEKMLPPNKSSQVKYIHTPRMLGSYVHNDPLYMAGYNSALILAQNGVKLENLNQMENEHVFGDMGMADLFGTVADVCRYSLKGAWVNKWLVNMRIRPEVFAHRVNMVDTGKPVAANVSDQMARGKETLDEVKSRNGNMLLKQLYPEGSPCHPSYPAGHAVVSGAMATILKIFFQTHNEDGSKIKWSDLKTPVHSINGATLNTYIGDDASQMTVVGEINKMASNVATGRNMAGVHYRSDGDKGNLLGEKIAISYVRDLKETYNFDTEYTLEKFDGTIIKI